MKQASRLLIAAVFALLLAACASSGKRAPMGAELPAPDTTTASGAYEGGTDYRIGASDLLKISVFGVQELERQARVNSNGQITLPLIGGVMAGGKTIPELEQELAQKYSDGYLQNPQVSVFVEEFTSQRVTVEGAVGKPGIYPITGRTTLLQAIALAQGMDELADQRGVVLFRQVNGERQAAAFDMSRVRSGEMHDPVVYGDDIIVVERSGSKTAVREFLNRLTAFAMFLAL
ncbi:MAG TPA: polysaccharide biosynthesis/export family protein [Chiayiivirga sp.]|nr:polysaccharide biosynthesis/export family protein [Chiayiivirga sp.]